jgi:hypothetical protein
MPEVRWEATSEEVAVLDGYCSATGKNRTDVIRNLVHEWSKAKKHEAMIVCRVAGINPAMQEDDRK